MGTKPSDMSQSLTLPGPNNTIRTTLANGITVLVRENFASPAVVVNGYLIAGSEDEPPGKRGLAGFTTDVMQRGTRRRPFSDLYEQVESIGAAFGVSSGSHVVSFGAKGLVEHFATLLDIVADVLVAPAFDVRQVERARTEILTDIRERIHDTRRLARLAFHELAYPADHPYHWSQMGYPDAIASISQDDLIEFHETYVSPQQMVIAVVGGIQTDAAISCVADAFNGWNKTRPSRAPLPNVPGIDSARRRSIPVSDKTQTSLVLGWPGPARAQDDFLACFVANTILGVFGMYGRLGEKLREQQGLAYYIYSDLDGGSGPGPWSVQAGLDPATVEQATTLILDEVRRIQDSPVQDEELADTIAHLTGSLPLALETNEGVSRSLVNIERYSLGLDYLQTYAALIEGVTSDQVQAAAQRWLDPDRYALALAGPGEVVDDHAHIWR